MALWASYYSAHKGKTSGYKAKVEFKNSVEGARYFLNLAMRKNILFKLICFTLVNHVFAQGPDPDFSDKIALQKSRQFSLDRKSVV